MLQQTGHKLRLLFYYLIKIVFVTLKKVNSVQLTVIIALAGTGLFNPTLCTDGVFDLYFTIIPAELQIKY